MGRKMGKTEGEAGTTHQSPKAEKRGKRTDSRNQSRKNGRDDTENGGKPQGRHANGKGKTVICRVGSERSPCPPFEVSPDGTGRRFYLENSGWRDPLGYHNAAKYPPADFFIDLVLCVVGRFACQVPNLSATRTAIPERFFGRKITAGNFMSRKPKA
ncbi:hypothetical protein NXW19_09030 [Bacteroides ovatus]|nr:hypothetical protein NXW19_09030 [Bacteroides ovatus]